jgi:O-antigen ligase
MFKLRISYSNKFALLSFIFLIFFTLFPKSEPFQPIRQEIGVNISGERNLINQIINSAIFIFSLIGFLSNFGMILRIIKKEKFLFLLLFWSLITISWSEFPLISFKRWFQIFTFYLSIITFLSYYNITDVVKIIKPIIFLYILITLLTVLLIPGAKDPEFNTWRGISASKNTLGETGVILSILGLILINSEKEGFKKNFAYLAFISSIVITLGTFSSTSYISLFIFLFGSFIYYVKKQLFNKLGVNNFLFYSFISSMILVFLISLYYKPDIIDYIQVIFGKNETFYDRGKLWAVMLWNIYQHPIAGCGFQGFWVAESPKIHLIYQTFIWLPNQAHNGYLDLINEIGLIGLILFLLVFISYFYRIIKSNFITPWAWFMILPLISNITESNFFRIGPVTPVFIMLSYLIIIKIKYKIPLE